jgi:type IV secretion system protein VirB10
MKLLDKLKQMIKKERNAPQSMNPANAGEEKPGEAVNELPEDFRVRENNPPDTAEIPSINRRTGVLNITPGSIAIMLALALLLFMLANIDKSPPAKRKPESETRIASTLPPLVVPPPPPVQPPMTQSALIGQGVPSPLPPMPPVVRDGKPVVHWTERKMGGSLLVTHQSGTSSASQQDIQPQTVNASHEGRNTAFGEQLEPTITKSASARTLSDRNMMIAKGTTLDCALETALDSSLPGMATCRLTRDVYSDNGNVVLLDRGSQLIGEYQGGIKQGQVRVFVLWTRAKTPNGVVIALDSPGTDALGRSGLEGWVDNHFLERFGAAILMTFIKDATTALVNRSTNTSAPFFGSTPTAGSRVVDRILESTVNIPPTIIKNQGDHIQVMVARDLNFSEVYDLKATQ